MAFTRGSRILRMNATPAFAAVVLCTWCSMAAAQEAPEPPSRTGLRSEPKIQRTVIDDKGARIEELRVRGQTQRISVQPKAASAPGYEIIPADAAREVSEGAGSTRGAAGKRVWPVLTF
jgi:hypothetical protein